MAKTALDAIDRKILKYLIKNARMPFLEIARECGISGAAIHQRIRKLVAGGVPARGEYRLYRRIGCRLPEVSPY